jgi:hypothetical protein
MSLEGLTFETTWMERRNRTHQHRTQNFAVFGFDLVVSFEEVFRPPPVEIFT